MTTEINYNPESCRAPVFGSRVAELAAGVSANAVMVYGFDFLLYPYVIYHYGALHGGLIMALASFAICLLAFRLYDWLQRDWLGIEAIKRLKQGGEGRFARVLSWALKKGDPAVLVLLSIKFDPFIATLYLRNGAYNGLSARDWRVFLSSFAIANAYWIAAIVLGITVVEWVMQLFGMGA